MIEIYLKYDNMHIFGIINALNCINNHVISCVNSMLSEDGKCGLAAEWFWGRDRERRNQVAGITGWGNSGVGRITALSRGRWTEGVLACDGVVRKGES